MFDSFLNYFDKFGPELLVIQSGLLVILCTIFLVLWFSNRRKYHNLKHAIPATVVKSYLDSIIQNSTALKSSLFRGGGLDLEGVPSVMPLSQLVGGDNLGISGAPSTALLEELNQKKALLASLEAQLAQTQGSLRTVESKLVPTEINLSASEKKVKELEALLAQSKSSSGADAAISSQLTSVTKERDEFRDKLKEFEIISDDLANLKRLQQENEQLKKSLAAQAGGMGPAQPVAAPQAAPVAPPPVQAAPVAAAAPTPPAPPAQPAVQEKKILNQDDISALFESFNAQENEEKAPAPKAAAPAEASETTNASAEDLLAAFNDHAEAQPETKTKQDKTPEDLLSEFEKMLG